MSRFFAAGSDSESESSSSDDEVQLRPMIAKPMQWSDEEEEVKRVVRSAKDKRYEELKDIIKKTRNHKKIKDMAKILADFEEMCRAYTKASKVIDKEGGVPRFYLRYLAELEDFVNECWEDKVGRKAMSKYNAKGLTALRTKLRKYNRDFETQIIEYKEKPDLEDEVSDRDESGESSDDDDDAKTESAAEIFKKEEPTVTKKPEAKTEDGGDGSDSDSMWYMSSSDSEGSDDNVNKYTGPMTADHFLKKTTTETDEKKKKKEEKRRTTHKVVRVEEESDEGDWEEVKGGASAPMERPKMFSKDAEITHEAVIKKLMEIISVRGKKGTDRSAQLSLLEELRTIASAKTLGTAMDIKIMFHIVASIFDYNPNIATCMRPEMWDKCVDNVAELLAILAGAGDEIICGSNISEDSETLTGAPPYCIRGCILTMVERMDDEFVKMLQACDAHSTEYIDRLKDETKICQIIDDLQKYLEGQMLADEELSPITTEEICRAYLRRITHLYYKFDYTVAKRDPSEPVDKEKDSRFVVDKLCKYIYAKDSTDRIRTRAMLCHVYHHALHDRWFEARDLMLMSHLQDTIHYSDIPTQIMYNRAMVQLGICAFRQGTIKDSHNCLVDIQSSGRAKELLAQGLLLQRQHERTPEQEKIEKRRQMPYHMHINLELLECVYLVSAMLIEIPYMAAHEFDVRRRMISKNFHHVMRMSDKQPLVGPPESMREHVVAASKAMKVGDWKACYNFVINDKMNSKVWDLFYKGTVVKALMTQKIKEESLRTYLFTYSAIYDSLSLVTLADMFELELPVVHAIINKMIINEELMASMDEPTQTVVMHRTEPTHLQALALQLSEKVSSLVDYNERTMETKSGIFFFQKQGGQGGYQGYQNRDGQGGGYRGNRDGQGGGYRGNRDRDGQGGGYRGNRDRDGQGGGYQGGYRGNKDRDGQGGGYQGGGYQGGGYQGGGYQGGGGYRGNRDRDQQGGGGGYQGGYRQGGYQQGGGGYQGGYNRQRPQQQNRY